MNKSSLDSPETTIKRAEVIQQKVFLRNVYLSFYKEMKRNLRGIPNGKIVEIGSGGGFIKEIIPNIITSDILKLPRCDLQFSVEKMPFKNNTVAAFIMLNVFHHIKDPAKALKEMSRCLKHTGCVVMVEPNNSLFSRFIYQKFHHEDFDPDAGWKIKSQGPLSGANDAIPWIIFKKDNEIFKIKFPELKLVKYNPHTPLSYLISGGFSHKQFLPTFTYKPIKYFESIISPFNNILGMFVTVVIKKK